MRLGPLRRPRILSGSGTGLSLGKHIVSGKPVSSSPTQVCDPCRFWSILKAARLQRSGSAENWTYRLAPTIIGKHEALAWLCEGLDFFASLGLHAVLNDKASKIPFASEI